MGWSLVVLKPSWWSTLGCSRCRK